MALRGFMDPIGTAWMAWDVPPHGVYTQKHARASRRVRVTPERPVRARRMIRPPELAGGWACFAAERQTRRLSPLTAQCDAASDAELETLCEQVRQQPVAPA